MTASGVVALVPVRSFRNGKTRLASALTPEERAAIGRRMLARVAGAAAESDVVDAVVVISPDPEVLDAAVTLGPGIVPLPQAADAFGLNGAIDQGRAWAERRGAAALLVLFGDLPLLTAHDVRAMVRLDAPVVVAPDRHGTGTNALLLRLNPESAAFTFQFGQDSFAHHGAEARRLRLTVDVFTTRGTAFDLDTPADYDLLGAEGWRLGAGNEALANAGRS